MPDGSSHSLTVIDKQTGEIVHKIRPKNVAVQNMPFMSLFPLTFSEDKIIYQPSMSNSVYEVYNDSIYCKYKIDFGKYWPDINDFEQLKDLHPQMIVDELKKNYVLYPSLLETDQTVFVCFSFGESVFTFFQNKENGVQKMFVWDKDGDLSLPVGVVNNQFISVKYSETLPPALLFYKVVLCCFYKIGNLKKIIVC